MKELVKEGSRVKVLNFGSLNIDYTYQVDHFVRAGETMSSESLQVFSGGKGLNQSIALSKAGADVWHAGAVGAGDGDFLIEQMKKAGALSKMALRQVGSMIRPGVSTFELDQLAEQIIRMHGGTPAFKGYGGFPGSICASLNDAVVHGIPNPDVILREGDIISIDTGAIVDGWVGDNAWTFYVGNPSTEAKGLCECTLDCLKAAIEQAVPGNHIGDVGHAVQSLAESNGYGVLRDYVGHGVGRAMHEDPNVPNYGKKVVV